MPAFTSFLNLYKPGGGSTGLILPDEVVDIDRINANMDLIDTFASGWGLAADRNHQFYGPAAGLAGVTGMKRGDTYKESDGSFYTWEFDGTNWLLSQGGMYLVRPTAVDGTGASINADGSVALGTGSLCRIDGVFTSRFSAYKIIMRANFASGQETRLQLANGGTAIVAGGSYVNNGMAVNNAATFSGFNNSASQWIPLTPGGNGTQHFIEIDVLNPSASVRTLLRSSAYCQNAGTQPFTAEVGGGMVTAAAVDGFQFNFTAGPQAGSSRVAVYGLR